LNTFKNLSVHYQFFYTQENISASNIPYISMSHLKGKSIPYRPGEALRERNPDFKTIGT
jgi:hypothetical protein